MGLYYDFFLKKLFMQIVNRVKLHFLVRYITQLEKYVFVHLT